MIIDIARALGRRRVVHRVAMGSALSATLGSAAAAQERPEVGVASGVAPLEVTVGDPFRARIRVDAPAGVTVEFAEQPAVTDAVQPLGRVVVQPGDPGDPYIADYPLVAWQTGTPDPPLVPVFVRDAAGVEYVLRVSLPMPAVRSVLPADTALHAPRPAKPVIDPPPAWPWWLPFVALLLLLLAAAARAALRPRTGERPDTAQSPRELALAELDQARELADAGEWKAFYSRISGTLRRYLATASPRWGVELTTTELIEVLHAGPGFDRSARVAGVLASADRVKFARIEPMRAEAERDWQETRELVESVEPAGVAAAPAGFAASGASDSLGGGAG